MKRKILTALIAVVIVLTVAPPVAALFVDIPFRTIFGLATSVQPDHSAGFYPENTYAYVSLDAKPTLGNIGELVKLRDGFGDAELLKDFIDDLRGGVSEDSGIELEQVSPWIGFRHSAGVTDAGVIGIIGVRNRDRAAEFIPVLIERGLDANVSAFTFNSDNGVDTWVPSGDSDRPALALTNDWLVISTGEQGLLDALSRMSGRVENSLIDNPHFVAASAVMADGHFVSAYLNVEDPAVNPIELMDGISGLFGEASWVAGSAFWINDGIVVEIVMPTGRDHGFDVPVLVDTGALVPLGTLAFAAASFDPDLDKWRAALVEYDFADTLGVEREDIEQFKGGNFFGVEVDAELGGGDSPTLSDLFDYGLLSISELLEVDLENDVFGNLSGNVVAGVPNYEFNQGGSMFGSTHIEMFALLSHGANEGGDLVGTFDGFLESMRFHPDSIDMGADGNARTFRLLDYRPTYVLHDEYLLIGSTSGAVEQVVEVQNGEFPSIDSDEEYRRAVEALPEGGSMLVYVGLDDVFAQMSSSAEGHAAEVYGLFAANLGSVASVYGSRGDYTRMTTVVTLFPE